MAREEAEKECVDLLIMGVSSNNHKEEALKKGAKLFMYKKEFWSKGADVIEEILGRKQI